MKYFYYSKENSHTKSCSQEDVKKKGKRERGKNRAAFYALIQL